MLRVGPLVVGVASLAAIPISSIFSLHVRVPWPEECSGLLVAEGRIAVERIYELPLVIPRRPFELAVFRHETKLDVWASPQLLHIVDRNLGYYAVAVIMPLWVPAFICLAWPVTSFILARRKSKRGFPVEPKPPDAAAPPSTS